MEMEMRERMRSRPRDRTPKICLDMAGDSVSQLVILHGSIAYTDKRTARNI